eukprot:XP_025981199.1 uncharacterized protein LOC100802634 [Glycine max]
MHLRSGKSVPHLTEFKTRTRMARPPPSNRNNDLPNMEGQPTQTSVSNANINSGIGAIPDQTVGTISSTASTVMNQTGVTSPMTNMTLASSTTSASAFAPWNNPSLGNPSGSPFRPPQNPLYGMPTSLMAGLQNSQPNIENLNMSSPSGSVAGNQGRVIPQHLTNTSVLSLRQQMDESNHDMVNMLTQQIGTVINPLIQNTNDSYQMLTNQISRIADFFGAPPIQQPPIRQIQIQAPVQEIQMPNNPGMQMAQAPQPLARIEPPVQQVEPNPGIVLVNRNQNADEVIGNIQQNRFDRQNNLAQMVETILVQNGLNLGLHRPNFVSPLSEYVLQTELPRGVKIPKFTKFAGETNESTVEHIARYLVEAGDLANNENLRMKFFPNSLTKNAFTWFTTLPPHSIHNWNQLERIFHEQFYMGQSKISLKELASVRRKAPESIDDYLNRFRLLKARYTQYLRDMAQLADRVRQLERLKAEKARNSKFHKKEKVAYVETNDSDQEFDIIYEDIEDNEVDLAELKPGPPYVCQLLRPSNGKNPVEPKNDKFVSKTYTFDITKCDEIFDLLVTDGQIVVPKGLKVPPIEQQKKRGYCKFHNFLGHKTSRCVLFRDLVQKALDEGRLKFGEKPKVVQANAETSKAAETLYAEPQEIMMVETMELSHVQVQDISEEDYNEQMKVVYPQAEEDLIDFLNRCKLENKIVMLCPRCSAVCDREATEGLKKYQVVNKGAKQNQRFDKGKRVMVQSNTNQKSGRRNTFAPPGSVPVEKWMHQGLIRFNKGIMEVGGSSGTKQVGPQEANKYSYRNNYRGKNPMTRTQWRRFQRQKKLAQQNPQTGQYKEVSRRPVKERLLPPVDEDKMEDEDLLDSEPDFDVICVVSILPFEYDVQSEVTEIESEFDHFDMADPKPVCYYVMNNGCVEEQLAYFEKPDFQMKSHLKPLFIRAKVENVGINKVLIDGGAAVNLMPRSMLYKIGKHDTDLSAHNIVLSNYEGKTGYSLGAIQVDVAVGSIVRPTLFLVIQSKANFNLLLGREWIHGVGAVPSTLHQKLIIWREDGIVENIEADQSFYKSEVDNVTTQTFDKKLANIAPCGDKEAVVESSDNVIHSVKLHPTYGFIWEREEIDVVPSEDGVIPPTGWNMYED